MLAVLHERVYQQPTRDVDELRRRLIDSWGEASSRRSLISDQWRFRLRASFAVNGRQFEHSYSPMF